MKIAAVWLIACVMLGLSIRAAADDPQPQNLRIPIDDPRLTVSGLPWFKEDKPALIRLPQRLKETFRPAVWSLAQDTSGGRIRFRTDSSTIALDAVCKPQPAVHMSTSGASGFDLYVDGVYSATAASLDESGKVVKIRHGGPWTIGGTRQMHEITIYLPLYSPTTVDAVLLDGKAKVEPAGGFANPKPVVYYGSSITQGGCASNPGGSCQAIVSRWLNVDFVNLGFSGNGLGDESVARAMTEIDCSCIVLDYWGNPSADQLKRTLPKFVDILRAKFPAVPILVVGPYYDPAPERAGEEEAKRKVEKEFVDARAAGGDKFMTFVEGTEMLSRENAFGLVDGRHCNSAGFYFCARGLEPYLRKALGIPADKGDAPRQ